MIMPRIQHRRHGIRHDCAVLLPASSLDVAGFVLQCVTAAAALTLAFIGLRLNAKPAIRVQVDRDGKEPLFATSDQADLSIHVELRGHFYGKPTASDTKITVNVEQSWGLERLRWNSPGKSESQDVARGKGLRSRPRWVFWRRVPTTGPSNFVAAEHLWITRDEHPETLTATLISPDQPGDYLGWIHASAKEGDCGVHVFTLRCRKSRSAPPTTV
jgi:hypothetical protein